MKKLLLGATLLLAGSTAFAQQDPQFTQTYFNRLYANPAVAGSNDGICATLVGRQQWVGFDGRPETYQFSGHMSFKDPWLGQKHGAGLVVSSDQLGQESTMNVKVSYAYRHKLGNNGGMISAGFALGMMQKTIGNDWNAVDNFVDDPSIPDNGVQQTAFDMDFGLYYKVPKKFYVGLSLTHITSPDLEESEGPQVPGAQPIDFGYGVAGHFYAMAGYQYNVTNDIALKPNVFIKSDAVSTTFDLGVIGEYQEKFWAGVTYRLQDAVAPMAGVNLQMPGTGVGGGKLRVGYSYDVTTSELRNHSSGSHEILVNYCFSLGTKVKVQRHHTVRWL
tara:strand:+ start:695 stop:1690 length:996 start_codon:yes stop_codon:yes gene_type:complete